MYKLELGNLQMSVFLKNPYITETCSNIAPIKKKSYVKGGNSVPPYCNA